MNRSKLGWIQRNRCRRDRGKTAFNAVRELVERVSGDIHKLAGGNSEIAALLDCVVDAEFRDHCRLRGIRGTMLLIEVNIPALVYSMRIRWAGILKERLQEAGFRRIAGVVFEYSADDHPSRLKISSDKGL